MSMKWALYQMEKKKGSKQSYSVVQGAFSFNSFCQLKHMTVESKHIHQLYT